MMKTRRLSAFTLTSILLLGAAVLITVLSM